MFGKITSVFTFSDNSKKYVETTETVKKSGKHIVEHTFHARFSNRGKK